MKIVKSENRTNVSECWNNFSGDAIQEFIDTYKPRFVDVLGSDGRVWQGMGNEEDKMVFEVPARPTWALVDAIRGLNANEEWVEEVNGKHVCRLWWD